MKPGEVENQNVSSFDKVSMQSKYDPFQFHKARFSPVWSDGYDKNSKDDDDCQLKKFGTIEYQFFSLHYARRKL